jgi:hypothetical protein
MFDEEDLLVNETNEIDLKIEISRLRQTSVKIQENSEPIQEPQKNSPWSLQALSQINKTELCRQVQRSFSAACRYLV